MKDWDGNIGRLKPYLVEMEARLAAVEARLPDPKEQAKVMEQARMASEAKVAETKPSPDPQKVASDAMKAFVDVTDRPAAPPADKKGASTKT